MKEKCNMVYVGETGRCHDNPFNGKLGDRKREHINDFKKAKEKMCEITNDRNKIYASYRTRNKSKQLEELKLQHSEEDNDRRWKTALLDHALKHEHEFKYDEMFPVHFKTDKRKRQMLESLYIYKKK